MKRLFIEIGCTSVVLLLVFVLIFLPAQKKYRQRAQTVRDNYQQLQDNLPVVMRSGQVDAEVAALSQSLGNTTKRMTTAVDKGAVATELRRKADELGLAVIAEEPWKTHPKTSTDEQTPWAGVFTTLEKKMTIEGTYESIGRFMEALTEMDDLTRTTSILVKKDETTRKGELHVEMILNLYDLHQLTLK